LTHVDNKNDELVKKFPFVRRENQRKPKKLVPEIKRDKNFTLINQKEFEYEKKIKDNNLKKYCNDEGGFFDFIKGLEKSKK